MGPELETETYLAGDVVETRFGVGVITKCPDEEDSCFQVMLWRVPGKSMGSSALSFLQPNVILGKLPVAPGMTTTKVDDSTSRKYMVNYYDLVEKKFHISRLADDSEVVVSAKPENSDEDNSRNRLSRLSLSGPMFSSRTLVSSVSGDGELVDSSSLNSAACAKFYPLLHELMKRGDETATATSDFLSKKEVANVVSKATEYTQKQSEQALEMGSSISPDEAVDGLASKVKEVVNEDELKQLVTMIKDDDLTVLLKRGKERLERLLEQDIPKATEQALHSTGIRIVNDSNDQGSPYKAAIIQSRQVALQSMEKLLDQAHVDPKDLEAIRETLGDNFNTMFDSLAQAAKSDRDLAGILETMNERTAEWQEATGRLLATKSASLFLEGASRIQARAANLFSTDQMQWAGEVGSRLTKAFTEGDAAVARLKSIELGENMRDRLVQAIEVRSESLGGLDGIIAGALTTIKGGESGDQMQSLLTTLQGRATSATKDANETLISVLASRSEFRDVALLKVEQVLCDLEAQFGDELSPEDIAAVAKGEGGTAKLFEPIAKRAAKEIEKQLDAAEESVSDPTMMDVLKQVRKIVSGELTLTAVMDEVVSVLNDDSMVAAGETLVKQGEQVLDAIEGVSGNKVVDDVMQIAEKAGITKDSVMEGIDKLDVNELLDNAGSAITDEKARTKLLSDATDTALDFILRILPSMPIPPFDGVKDGLVYHVSNLSMQGFKVKKENILVEIAGMRATKKGAQNLNEEECVEDTQSNEEQVGDSPSRSRTASTSSERTFEMDFDTNVDENVVVKATELLIIDVREVSAVFNDAVWGFEQTYLPYLKGNGKFDVRMSNGSIRLAFELRKRLKEGADGESEEFIESDWEPVLCLHDRDCSIGSVELVMQGESRLAWVINKAASMFKGLLRDYVVKTILHIIADKSGWILAKLNEGLSPFWDVLLRTAKLQLIDLEEAGREDIVQAQAVEQANLIELVWREHNPLGMNLLMNDESGQLKVVDFPRGSQARNVCEKRNLDPEGFKGATVVAVNGMRYSTDEDLFDALRDPSRPKTVQFELAETEDAERIRKFVEESMVSKTPAKPEEPEVKERKFRARRVVFEQPGDLGVEFANSEDNFGLVVQRFLEGEGGIVGAAERAGQVKEGDLLTHVNGKLVLGEGGIGRSAALKALEFEGGKRPLSLSFAEPYLLRSVFEESKGLPVTIGGPHEFQMAQQVVSSGEKRVVLSGFKDVDGVAEKTGVLLGDYLVFINGVSVGAGCRWMGEPAEHSLDDVYTMLKSTSNYPIGLTLARPLKGTWDYGGWLGGGRKTEEIAMESSETICVTAESPEQLGLVLETMENSDIAVSDLEAVPGPFQLLTKSLEDPDTKQLHLSIESVNGEFVPSFANAEMVTSAMDRRWKAEGRVEVLFCDDERKQWTHSLENE